MSVAQSQTNRSKIAAKMASSNASYNAAVSLFSGIATKEDLTEFVTNSVQVPIADQRRYNEAVDEVVKFLQADSTMASRNPYGSATASSFPWKIKRVFKSGSLAKGTAVR